MDISRVLWKSLSKNKDKTKARLETKKLMIYLKFIKYIPTFSVVPTLLEKDVKKLSTNDLKTLYQFREEQDIGKVFERYLKKEENPQDVLTIYDFMKAHPLEEYMQSKLTVREARESRELVRQMLDRYSNRELGQKLKNYNQNPSLYEKLTVVEAYSFYQIEGILRRQDPALKKEKAMKYLGLHPNKYFKK